MTIEFEKFLAEKIIEQDKKIDKQNELLASIAYSLAKIASAQSPNVYDTTDNIISKSKELLLKDK